MSISSFIVAGIEQHNNQKRDVSLSLVCSALDATAKKIFPSENNNQRNKKFIRKYMPMITLFGFPGIIAGGILIKCHNVPNLKTDKDGYVGIEDIIYHTIRCGLIHECEIENLIEFTDETIIGDFYDKFKVPKQLFWGLALSVILCEQNKNESTRENVFINIADCTFDINELWGQENKLQKRIIQKKNAATLNVSSNLKVLCRK